NKRARSGHRARRNISSRRRWWRTICAKGSLRSVTRANSLSRRSAPRRRARDAEALVDARIALEVFRQRAVRSVIDRQIRECGAIEAKALVVRREDQRSVGRQQLDHLAYQRRVIALDVEGAFHALGARVRRRVEED